MAMMEDFTFQYNDGEILNTEYLPGEPFVDITKVSGLDSGEFRVTERTREGADGGFLDTGWKEMSTIVLEGTIYGDETYLERLRANWRPYREGRDGIGGGATFRWGVDGLNRMVRGRSLGMKYDWDQIRRTGQTEVQFQLRCEDPTIYAEPGRTVGPIILSNAGATGYDYPRSYPRAYGAGTQGNGSLNVYNFGTKETYPDITILGPAINPFLINDSWVSNPLDPDGTTAMLRFVGTLNTGEFLTISTRLRTVILNDQANRRTWLATPYVWWGLVPGDNFVRYGADSGIGSQASLLVYDAFE